jgi:hypothetical protein
LEQTADHFKFRRDGLLGEIQFQLIWFSFPFLSRPSHHQPNGRRQGNYSNPFNNTFDDKIWSNKESSKFLSSVPGCTNLKQICDLFGVCTKPFHLKESYKSRSDMMS